MNGFQAYAPSVPPVDLIPPKMLLDQNIRWWRTKANGGVDDQFESQGLLCAGTAAAAGNFVFTVDLAYTCEFKNFVSTATTPMRFAADEEKAVVPRTLDDEEWQNLKQIINPALRVTTLRADPSAKGTDRSSSIVAELRSKLPSFVQGPA